MTNESIKNLINQLNGTISQPVYKVYKYQISDNVEYGKVWYELEPNHQIESNFFFIKENKSYAGAIQILGANLHWYILESERNKGYLTNALNTAILPFLFSEMNYEKIKITIPNTEDNDALASAAVAKKVGFKNIDNVVYVLLSDQFDFTNENLSIRFPGIKLKEYERLKNEINEISIRLQQIHTQFEFSTGLKMKKYQNPPLDEIAEILALRRHSLEDMYHDHLIKDDINFKNETPKQ
ncbi:GNAT family N-acetyltransferase [Mesonia sp. HuA40]|uniref:GNAT family N-acetyltransferase n=1 Tax=Mesonia sp. HuA40 TaxID=2602761 RepID=UPI0011CB45E3|nr:GNAT family N-acetyltransferase [Mesonia sp. HuA40]TXK74535.1 GNAT family N-acetyltransferase [Mesonia sp. HuA40]